MSKRSDRREAERLTRKLAYQQLRQERTQSPAEVSIAAVTPEGPNTQTDLSPEPRPSSQPPLNQNLLLSPKPN